VSKWTVEGDEVKRAGLVVARISKVGDMWRWDGVTFEMWRSGFANRDAILEDVKYFHRYRGKPSLTVTYASGRKVSYR
jgi:hypothetical protein